MFQILEKLHNKPADTRRSIGIFFASLVTCIIFIIWILTLGTSLSDDRNTVFEEESARILSPLETIGEGLSSFVRTTKDRFSEAGF